MLRKVSFEISKISILSQFLENLEQETKEIQIPHFSSILHNDSSFSSVHGDRSVTVDHRDLIEPVVDDSSSKSDPQNKLYADRVKDSFENGAGSKNLNSSPQNYILKELCASIVVECAAARYGTDPLCSNKVWVGNGSISGFDMTVSLTEIQVKSQCHPSFPYRL